MANKALVVGIGTYNAAIATLLGAVPSAKLWEDLLRDGFGYSVTSLPEPTATLSAVQDELKKLLKDATVKDRLVFVFCGHGGKVGNPQGGKDEALLLSHPYGTSLAAASLTDKAFAEIVKNNPRNGANFTLILECCFSGGFEVLRLAQTQLEIFGFDQGTSSSPSSIDDSVEEVHEFGLLYQLPANVPRPLIIAASRKDESAGQLPDPRMGTRFTSAAVRVIRDAIRDRRPISPGEVVEIINPLSLPPEPQTATLLGDRTRDAQPIFS